MVLTLGGNENNDIYIGSDGQLVMLEGVDAIADACSTATRAQLNEMIYATQSGIPNFQVLWVGSPDYQLWKAAIIATLESVEGVVQVNSLNITINNNKASYVAQIITIYSQTPITING